MDKRILLLGSLGTTKHACLVRVARRAARQYVPDETMGGGKPLAKPYGPSLSFGDGPTTHTYFFHARTHTYLCSKALGTTSLPLTLLVFPLSHNHRQWRAAQAPSHSVGVRGGRPRRGASLHTRTTGASMDPTPRRRCLGAGGGLLLVLFLVLGVTLGVLVPARQRHHPKSPPPVQDDDAMTAAAGGVPAETGTDKAALPPFVEDVVNTVVNTNPAEVIIGGTTTVEDVLSNLQPPPAPPLGDPTAPALKPFQAYVARTSSLQGLKTCYPKDGTDVARMVMGADCTVIILTKSSRDRYDINQTLVVSSTKIIIGHPLDIPRLNTTNRIERLFDVTPTGYLDVRCVQLYRGFGRVFDEGTLRTIVGGTVRVQLGGVYRGTEVIYREQPQLLANIRADLRNPRNRRRTFGGTVLVLGGTYHCVGCQLMRWAPYGNVLPNVIQIGRDILVVAGVASNVGGYVTNALAFTSSINVGNNLCVLGGVAVWIGGGGNAAALMIGQYGAGQNLWVGGGVMIMVGYQDSSTFFAVSRAGFGQYTVGGGVFIMVAELENRAWGVGSVFNAGQAYACGGGIFKMIGGDGVNSQLSTIQAVAGASTFVGSGDMLLVGFPMARAAITQAQFGAGLIWFIGGGTGTYVYTPAISVAVVRVQAIRGIELFMGCTYECLLLTLLAYTFLSLPFPPPTHRRLCHGRAQHPLYLPSGQRLAGRQRVLHRGRRRCLCPRQERDSPFHQLPDRLGSVLRRGHRCVYQRLPREHLRGQIRRPALARPPQQDKNPS